LHKEPAPAGFFILISGPLWETSAILNYVAEKAGKFMSTYPAKRLETIQWVMWQMRGVGPMFGQLGFVNKFAVNVYEGERPHDRYVAESKRLLGGLDKRLANNTWIMNDDYSIADSETFSWVRNLVGFYGAGESAGFSDLRNVARALAEFVARPAVIRDLSKPA
jgi:GSH-dependent disulfide-bond oxidoreductase